MCGIFGLLLSDSFDFYSNKKTIEEYFEKGKKRGPEHSLFTKISKNIVFGFHRLCINGLDEISNQPIHTNRCVMMCNGEIYNYKELIKQFNLSPTTNSDCEVIVRLYEIIGLKFIDHLDGVFSFVIYDTASKNIVFGRDPYGVRPLYICEYNNNNIGFASDLAPLMFDKGIHKIQQYPPGTISLHGIEDNSYKCIYHEKYFFNISYIIDNERPIEYYMFNLVELLKNSVNKRVDNCERDIACLLSGGLDSSLISALASKKYYEKTGKNIQTYSIGLNEGVDLKYAQMVADHIKSQHSAVIVSNEEFLNSINDVIGDIESYDTTTIRASVGNWNIAKYIKEYSDAKVVFNGDGADELMGGYLYFHCAPNDEEFHNECLRLLSNISCFDVLRSDKSISSHGLEPRTPFLDKTFTKFYLSIPIKFRNHCNGDKCEKYLIRKSFEVYYPELLPSDVLWRKKEAFSDGVSSEDKSWYKIIQENIKVNDENNVYSYNPPQSNEQLYYRQQFCKQYTMCENVIPYYWMPNFINDVSDASARTLNIYKQT